MAILGVAPEQKSTVDGYRYGNDLSIEGWNDKCGQVGMDNSNRFMCSQ